MTRSSADTSRLAEPYVLTKLKNVAAPAVWN